MKKLIIFLFSLLPLFLFGQDIRVFTVKAAISQSGGGAGYWTVNATNVNDPGGLYDATEITVGDKLYFSDGGIPYSLSITLIVSAVGADATFRVSNVGITGISSVPTTNNAFISRGTTNYGFIPTSVANISANELQLAEEYNAYLIDSLLANAGSGADTLYLPDGTALVDGDTLPAALDSVRYSGDSAYAVSQNGAEFYTGQIDFPKNRGRIIYVSKSGWRGAGTEEVGNPEKPYKTPWAAAAVMQSGDLMYCFGNNTYTLGPVGSGADKEATGVNSFAFWTGNIDTAYFHFEPKTVFRSIGAAGSCFFTSEPATNTLFLRVTGAATFNYSSNAGYTDVFRIITTSASKNVDFYFEADQFVQTAWSQVRMNGRAVIKVNKVYTRITSSNAATFGFGLSTASLNARKSSYSLDISEFDFRSTALANTDCLLLLYGLDTAQVDVNVRNVKYTARSPLIRHIGLTSFLRNSTINIAVGNGFIDDQYLNSISSTKSFTINSGLQSIDYSANTGLSDTARVATIVTFPSGGVSSINNVFNIRFGNLESAMTIAQQPGDTSNFWNIQIGNYKQLRNCPLILNSTSDNQISTGNLNVYVGTTVATSPIVVDTENHFNFTVSGLLRTSTATPIFANYSSSTARKRSFAFARLINNAAVAPITSTSAISVETMGVYSNSTLVDANVTELIESIARNSNVR